MESKYQPSSVEKNVYEKWVKAGYFTAGDLSKRPYCIVIPPPNVTGKLHLGHAWDTTIQDILCRYQRLQGRDVLWLAGMDHAGIATQAKVDERLAQQGISRYDIGREAFLDHAWSWKEEYAQTIRQQWSKLGLSLDYSRERFTLDEGLSHAVRKVFVDLYNEGLIYQGERIINWDPQAKTALSNIEVEHKTIPGKMYYFRYEVVETKEQLIIATTRPETMFADQAIFVHPEDSRYTHLVGKHAINPANQEVLPIMADDYIDMSFGTAVMKCTPAHDPNDFALAQKYDLPMPICMNPDGTMNELCGPYAGMDRFACRQALVADFEAKGVVDHIEEHEHQVGHSQRTGVIVEPYLSKQWFVKMEPLAREVLANQQIEDQKISFVPTRFEKTFTQWLENIEDWCISRQLWWGHRIPAWTNRKTKEIWVSMDDPVGEEWEQDPDVLDTWFSSGLWAFSTLGWPEKTEDLSRYFPNNTLVTGYDIIFFWVARMAFQTRFAMNNRPFEKVLIHGLVRDSQGRKMSKSLGNGIDPMDVIDEYGADALRFFLTTNSTPGLDLRYDETKLKASWNFINKLWNASRFVLMNQTDDGQDDELTSADRWIMARFDQVLAEVSANMDKYELALVGNALHQFVWDDFCSWYIEASKVNPVHCQPILQAILKNILIMLSPFMPFVCEAIYLQYPNHLESINLESWPKPFGVVEQEDSHFGLVKEAIGVVREIKNTYGIKPSADVRVMLLDDQGQLIKLTQFEQEMMKGLAHAQCVLLEGELLVRPLTGGSLSLVQDELIDVKAELAKLKKEKIRLEQEVARCEKMLANPRFVDKAPEQKVQAERDKLLQYQAQLEVVVQQIVEFEIKIEANR